MSVDTSKGHPEMDYKQHEETYSSFVALFKWGTIFCIGLLLTMLVFMVLQAI